MKSFFKLIFVLSLFFLNTTTYAGSNIESRIFVFHINGINTQFDDALKNRRELEKAVKINSNMITWGLLYNPTSGSLFNDLMDVYLQKIEEKLPLDVDDYVKAYMKAYGLNYAKGSAEYEKLKNSILEQFRTDPAFLGNHFNTILEDFKKQVPEEVSVRYASVVDALKDYSKTKHAYVLFIPHSQGNLYANQLVSYLVAKERFPSDHLAVLGIATPADSTPMTVLPAKKTYPNGEPNPTDPTNNTLYVTSVNDHVINSMRIHNFFTYSDTEYPEPSNVKFSGLLPCPDKLCHSLTDAYLHYDESKNLIAKQINLLIIALKDKLIREGAVPNGNIRLVFSTSPAKSLGIGPVPSVRLIQQATNRILCTQEKCDSSIFGYVSSNFDGKYTDLSQEYSFDHYATKYIGFKNKLPAGFYSATTDDPQHEMVTLSFSLYGDIGSAIEWEQHNCDSSSKPYLNLVDIRQISGDGNSFVQGWQNPISYRCAVKLKEPILPGDIIIANVFSLN
jgi:hypothetical protein